MALHVCNMERLSRRVYFGTLDSSGGSVGAAIGQIRLCAPA
ncbi:MAG: hypothetical protein PUH98_04425 [Collinsella sp.]|nr:hypothetical protein [Collinsella sp.]